VALAAAAALAMSVPPAAGARPANPPLWGALSDKLICGLAVHAPGTAAQLLCADGWDKSHRATLTPGQTWRHGGLRCSVRRASVRCTNRSHHGFTITRRAYRPF
jgi:hypothetical protein